jgi:hypothetical protein
MSSPSREHLLGYLLRALEPAESERLEAELEHNPALAGEMQRLEARLEQIGLRDQPEHWDPPAGLAQRTCEYVALAGATPLATPTVLSCHGPVREWRITWSDLVTIAAVLVAAVSLLLPALSMSRFQSQIAACQNQLRLIGFGLHGYSELMPDHSFPGPDMEGNRAVAGIVAPLLVSHRLAEPPVFFCPASAQRQRGSFHMPTLEEIDGAEEQELKALKRTMGGDFGYNLGYVEDGKLLRPCNARRAAFVLVADAPSNSQPRRVSGNHGGRGQNMLYEDGRVRFIPYIPSPELLDDPYHNRDGWVAAGLDRDDAVLGASEDPPLPLMLMEALR